ncbi:trigger factor, partial [Streptococcus pneumoniae]
IIYFVSILVFQKGQKGLNIIKRHPIRCSKTLIGCLLS